MKCLLYIPPFECEGIKLPNIAYVRIGGLTLYQRACRSIQKAAFDEIIIAKPKALEFPADDHVTIPLRTLDYETRIGELSEDLRKAVGIDSVCICVLDGMLSPECLSMRPVGADVRIYVDKSPTGVYFMMPATFKQLLATDENLDDIDNLISESFDAPERTLYHRVMSSEDIRLSQRKLTKSLKKPLGRDADGIVAYFINRPCSLQISKRLANSFVTPNMVSAFGLILGLGAAALVATGVPFLMVIAVIVWQIASMVDGIDGELARMRMSPSHSGEWFDTVADDITNITFMLGLGHGLYLTGLNFPFMGDNSSIIFLYVAMVVCGLMVIVVGWFYIEFIKLGIASHNHFEWGFETENKSNKEHEHRNIVRRVLAKIAGGFAWCAKRDFYTFLIMILVLCSLYRVAYFVMLTGAICVGVGGLIALTIRAIRGCFKKK